MPNQIHTINAGTFSEYEDISINVKDKRLTVFIRKMQDLDLKPFFGHPLYYQFIKWCSNSGIGTVAITTPATSAADGTYTNKNIVTTGEGVQAIASFVVAGGLVTAVVIKNIGVQFEVNDTFTCADLPGALFTVLSLSPDLVFLPDTPQAFMDLYNGVEYVDNRGNDIFYEGMIPMLVYNTFARFIEADAVRYTATGPVTKIHDNATALSVSDTVKLVQQQRSVANAHANEVIKYLYDHRKDFTKWMMNQKNATSRQAGPRIRQIDKTQFNYPNGGNGFGGYDGDFFNIGGLI